LPPGCYRVFTAGLVEMRPAEAREAAAMGVLLTGLAMLVVWVLLMVGWKPFS
jgi:hypothetical protein